MSTLVLTIREGIRYRGRSGHWSWIAHRISGLAILAFLVIHVWDTANAHFAPHLYDWSIAMFKHPLFAISEVPLMAAVLFHAFNGIRITMLDFKPEWWKYQQRSAIITWGIFMIIFVPVAIIMFSGFVSHCSELGSACWTFPRLSDFPASAYQ